MGRVHLRASMKGGAHARRDAHDEADRNRLVVCQHESRVHALR
jgi:hypothetical protein